MSSNRSKKSSAPASAAKKPAGGTAKKPYTRPTVRAYGNIRDVTQGSHRDRPLKDNAPGSLKTGA